MKKKKILVGAIVVAMALSTATVAYATGTEGNKTSDDAQHKEQINMEGGNPLSFDEKSNLPDGVLYFDEISKSGGDSVIQLTVK